MKKPQPGVSLSPVAAETRLTVESSFTQHKKNHCSEVHHSACHLCVSSCIAKEKQNNGCENLINSRIRRAEKRGPSKV